MKFIKLLAIAVCALALVSGSALAQEKKSCCDKAKAKGEECTHACCVEAKKGGKVCEKCNPKSDKKDEKK